MTHGVQSFRLMEREGNGLSSKEQELLDYARQIGRFRGKGIWETTRFTPQEIALLEILFPIGSETPHDEIDQLWGGFNAINNRNNLICRLRVRVGEIGYELANEKGEYYVLRKAGE